MYLDDIAVYGGEADQVWRDTCIVMERLCSAGFMINTRKCKFMVNRVKMLGYFVENGTLMPNYSKLDTAL